MMVEQARLIPPSPSSAAGRRLNRIVASGGARVDRFNRGFLLIVGIMLATAGAGGLLAQDGSVSWDPPGSLYGRGVAHVLDHRDVAAAIAMAASLALLVLGLRWALAQLRPVSDGERLGTLRLSSGPLGRTTVAATTVAKAAASDIARRPGITTARVRLRALQPRARVTMAVELSLDADADAVLGELEGALSRLLGALGADEAAAETEIRLRFAKVGRSTRSTRSEQPSRVV